MQVSTQLNFGGNCEEAFRFYEQHLGAQLLVMMRQEQAADSVDEAGAKILHARMNLAGTRIMGNDVPRELFRPIRSSYLHLSVDSIQEAERVFQLLSDGGEVYMPLEENFFAVRFSQLRDRFGLLWTIMHERTRSMEKPQGG